MNALYFPTVTTLLGFRSYFKVKCLKDIFFKSDRIQFRKNSSINFSICNRMAQLKLEFPKDLSLLHQAQIREFRMLSLYAVGLSHVYYLDV